MSVRTPSCKVAQVNDLDQQKFPKEIRLLTVIMSKTKYLLFPY
jgi:hypothetical protein